MSELYSVRMRAAQGGPHEKGGHHIIVFRLVRDVVANH